MSSRLSNQIDIHTHRGPLRSDAVVCVDPVESVALPPGDGLLSVGIHPWNAHLATPEVWQRLAEWLADPRVAAIGEIGLDSLRGPDAETQMDVFERQVRMADNADLPVVIHSVRNHHNLPAVRRRMHAVTQWIVHGFRGNATTARQLLDAGIDLSFGERYNAEAFDATPPERRYRETD